MKIYLVQEFSREDYDFSTEIKNHGAYVNRDEAVARAKEVFEDLKQRYADEIDRHTRKEYEDDEDWDEDYEEFDEDGEVEFYTDDDRGLYELKFGSEEDFELHNVKIETIKLGNEAYVIHRKCKRELLSDDIQNKAREMDIDLEGEDLERIVLRVERGLDNNEGLWESYWLTIESVLEEI